jgi:diacylglycerol kinase (ATP)
MFSASAMPSYRRILFIINPTAGQRSTTRSVRKIEETLAGQGIDFEVRTTEAAGDTQRWARAAHAEGFDLVTVVGGDGTVREAVGGLVRSGSRVPLAQIPTGTTNVTARALSIPMDVRKALNVIIDGKTVAFDVGYLPDHDHYFVFVAGAGYDASLISDTHPELKRKIGFFAYVASGVKHFFRVRPVAVRIDIDGKTTYTKAHTVMAINIGNIANLRWSLAPDIDPHDGKLNIMVLSSRSYWGSLLVLLRVITKRYHGYAHIRHFQGTRIRVVANPPLPFEIDGETLGTTPFLAEVIPAGIRYVVPIDYN